MSFDLDQFVLDLRRAAASDTAVRTICETIEAAIADPTAIRPSLPTFDDREALLYEDDAISIWHCVYHSGATIPPHDHQMAAIIGLYVGREQNDFYEADPAGGVRKSSEVFLETGKTLSIGPSAIHSVACISEISCRGFHVYLGNLTETDRWLFDVDHRQKLPFNEVNYAAMKRTA
ncbi:MAG: hypothetical protein P8I56_11225 [Paracoccaceae bacterium]|nr:hypothetical protein [Paracoccaceae bacterium]